MEFRVRESKPWVKGMITLVRFAPIPSDQPQLLKWFKGDFRLKVWELTKEV